MEHDAKCERLELIKTVRRKMSLNVKESACLAHEARHGQLYLCFCMARVKAPGFAPTYDEMSQLARNGISRVQVLRTKGFSVSGSIARGDLVRVNEDGKVESVGNSNVILVDFRNRKRISSSGEQPEGP